MKEYSLNERKEVLSFLPGVINETGVPQGHEGFYRCTLKPDIVYCEYGDTKLTLQLIIPEPIKKGQTFPLIVFVQGAAWFEQDKYTAIPNLSYIAQKGFIIASVQVRYIPDCKFPCPIEDVKCAIRFLRANSEEYRVDKNLVGIWGDSSGGHLSLMTAFTKGKYKNGFYPDEDDSVLAVCDFYGITDIENLGHLNTFFEHYTPDSPEGLFIGGNVLESIEAARAASPLYNIPDIEDAPNILIVHGDSDNVVNVTQSVSLYKKLCEAGIPATFVKVRGADHGPGIWTKRVLDRVYDFFSAAFYL